MSSGVVGPRTIDGLLRILANLPLTVWTATSPAAVSLVSVSRSTPIRRERDLTGLDLDVWDDPIAGWLRDRHERAFRGERVTEEVAWRGRWWEVTLEPLVDGSGAVEEVLGTASDVTDVHRARELEGRMSALVESARIAIISVDLDGRITSWNRGAVAMLGWRPEEVIGRSVRMIDPIDPDAVPTRSGSEEMVAAAATSPYVESKRRHRDGYDVDVGVSIAVITGRDGTPIGTSGFYLDLAERNAAVSEAAASRAELRVLADQVQDVVYRTRLEPDRVVEYASPSIRQVLGYEPEQFLDDPAFLFSRLHPDDLARLQEADADPMIPSTVRVRVRHGDGSWRWIEDRRSPVVVDGRVVAIAGIARDVTDEERSREAVAAALEREQRAAEELRRADGMKSAFLSAVSHELRTPLTSVLGFSETVHRLLSERGTDPDIAGYLERLLRNAHRLQILVDDLLDVDRLTRGTVEPDRRPLRLDELARAAARRYRGPERTIELVTEPLELVGDPLLLDRAIDNLVRNADRHTPPGTTIWVRVGPVDDGARLVVEDDGPGVPEELWSTIFEPFQQGPSAAASASPGTGIGLSLVERFVAVHGGSVRIGDRVGGGAAFTVDLPLTPQLPA